MNPKWLVLSRHDFGSPITLSFSTDLFDSLSEAEALAEEYTTDAECDAYIFKLVKEYVLEGQNREVDRVVVTLPAAGTFKGDAAPWSHELYTGELSEGGVWNSKLGCYIHRSVAPSFATRSDSDPK